MSQLTIDLALDNYKSTLSQSYNWWAGSIYVNNVPDVTFPTGKKVLLTIEPEKDNMQVVELDGRNSTTKTLNCTWATVKRWEGATYSATTHGIGSLVKISIPYDARDDIKTAVNTKVNTNSTDTDTGKFADATARDAYFTSPVEWNTAFVTGVWWTDYISGAWTTRASSSNASTTTKWVVEIATQAETEARTATWWSWATLVPTAATLSPSNITTITPDTWDKLAFADVSASNVFWSATLQTLCDVGRPLATNAEAQAGTWTTQAITPLQLKNFAWVAPTAWTLNNAFPIVSSMTTTATTPTMKTQATVTRDWTYTITFTWSTNYWFWYIQIYKNWSAFWTLRAWVSWATYSENLTFAKDDLLQLYMYNDSPWTCTCTNYSVQYNNYIMTNTTY